MQEKHHTHKELFVSDNDSPILLILKSTSFNLDFNSQNKVFTIVAINPKIFLIFICRWFRHIKMYWKFTRQIIIIAGQTSYLWKSIPVWPKLTVSTYSGK